MLLDVRTYTCRPGTINAHLKLYSEKGKPVQSKHLGQPLLFALLRQVTQTSTLIFGYMKMQEIEKIKELLCGQIPRGLVIQRKVQNLGL